MKKQEKEIVFKKLFDDTMHKDRINIQQTIKKVSQNISKNKTKKNYPYLLASDSFYYYSLTQSIIEKSNLTKTTKGSKYLNKMMLAPEGHWEPITLHPYVGAFIYKTMRIFNPKTELMRAVSYTPILITLFSLFTFILLCFHFKIRFASTLTGSLFFALSPAFIKRSSWGWYDNDPYTILFSLLILLSLFTGLSKNISLKFRALSGCLCAFLITLYALFWQGWVFIFTIIFASGVTIFLYYLLYNREKTASKRTFKYFLLIITSNLLFIGLIFGFKEFFILFKEGWIALQNFLFPQLSAWPDLYISVGELHDTTATLLIQQIGSAFFFYLSIFGILSSIWFILKKSKKYPISELITIIIFFIMTFYISLGAQRFAILCLVPVSLLFTIGINNLHTAATYQIKNKKTLLLASLSLSIIIISSSTIPIKSLNKSINTLIVSIYNDTWDEALTEIKNSTPKESIINTWWPPGHFIKSMANRRVTFDGATINKPQAYWMANIFLSDSEKKAVGMIRMINTSANQASDFLTNQGIPLSTSVLLLKEISKLDRIQAGLLLTKLFKSDAQINQLLSLTHKKPPPSYLLIYNEFVENNLQLGFIGKWNFERIEKINTSPDILKNVPPRNSNEYIQFLWDLVGGPFKYSGKLAQISKSEKEILFEENVTINLEKKFCFVNSEKYGKGVPKSIFYLEDGKIIEKNLIGAKLPFSVIFYKRNKQYGVVLLDRPLAKSLLIQLYFFKGEGFKYFDRVIQKSDLTGRTEIDVFKVDWEAFEKDLKSYRF